MLVSKLRAVLDGQSPDTIPVNQSLEAIKTQQDQIGWEQLLRGRFGWAWNTHCKTQPSSTTTFKGHWTAEVIYFIWDQSWKLWELRNQDWHGRDLATSLQAQAQQMEHELQRFYDEYTDKVPQHLAWLFDMTNETHLAAGCRECNDGRQP